MKRFFAAANTCTGFVSYFESVFRREDWEKIYLIKGGSGVGKSTALRKIGEFFFEQGRAVEEILCSSDPNSLDGINIPELRITFLDATAPHAMEATMPIALEEIIDFAQFLNEENLKKEKEVIGEYLQKKKHCYAYCYDYLKCVKVIREINEKIYLLYINSSAIQKAAKQIGRSLLEERRIARECSDNRKLFAEAFNASGITDVGVGLLDGLDVYTIEDSNEYASDIFMKEILQMANSKGYKAEVYLSVFDPNKIKVIVIEERRLAFATRQEKNSKKIDTANWIEDGIARHKNELEQNEILIRTILEKARQWLIQAKDEHEKLEKIYSGNMDFVSLDQYILGLLKPYEGR